MDVFILLTYINKASLLAFFVTTLIVGYQIYLLKKEKNKEKAPKIPDFKEKSNLNMVANFTSLPKSLTQKEIKPVNYARYIFLIISLLTVIVVIFVVSLIKKNSTIQNQALLKSKAIISPKPLLHPTSAVVGQNLSLSPSPTVEPTVQPTIEVTVEPTLEPTLEPTEIILAKAPTLTEGLNPTQTTEKPQVLPETGSWQKGFLIIAVAISTIFFSFWF